MKMKALALFLCVLIVTSASGIAYAQWNDVIRINSMMEFGTNTIRFDGTPLFWDNEDTKDVATCQCEYVDYSEGGYEKLVVALGNAYPAYEAYCNFTLKNVGELPNHIVGVILTLAAGLEVGYNYSDANGNPIGWRVDDASTKEPVLTVYVHCVTELSLVSNELYSEEILEGTATVQVSDGAEECQTYSFGVMIVYEVI